MQYQWREGGPIPKVRADVFGGVVAALAEGAPPYTVSPKAIVDEARKRGSPIKALFNWNDATAGEAWRCAQARAYLGRLEIVIVEQRAGRATSSRAFYSVKVKDRGYMARDRVLTDRDLRLQVIAAAKKELKSYIQKFGGVLALGNYVPRLNAVIGDMQSEIARLADVATKPKTNKKTEGERTGAPA